MNKKELVKRIAERGQMPQEKASQVIQVILDSISKTLKQGGHVRLQGLGKFATVQSSDRVCYNFKTKEPFKVKGKKVVRFKCSSVLQQKIEAAPTNIPDNHA